jgi:predicted secreted protein
VTWLQAIIVYFVCWWLLFFMALPIGVRSYADPVPGTDPGAPQKARLGIKAVCVTVLAAFATWGLDLIVASGIVAVK